MDAKNIFRILGYAHSIEILEYIHNKDGCLYSDIVMDLRFNSYVVDRFLKEFKNKKLIEKEEKKYKLSNKGKNLLTYVQYIKVLDV
jgi:predicted transcriptional regulator